MTERDSTSRTSPSKIRTGTYYGAYVMPQSMRGTYQRTTLSTYRNCRGEVGFQILPSTSRGLVATEPAKKHIAQLAVKESPERRRNTSSSHVVSETSRNLLLHFELNSNKTEKLLHIQKTLACCILSVDDHGLG